METRNIYNISFKSSCYLFHERTIRSGDNHLQQIFVTFDGYPNWVVLQILNKFEIDLSTTSSTKNQQPDTRMFLLLYVGMQGEHALKHIKREINKFLTEVKNMQLVNTGTKLGTKFSLKDKTKNHHHLT